MSTKINVLVVEDEKNIGNFISTTLKNNHYKVIECQTGSEALSITSSHCPDVILLDLGLPDLDGLTVLKSIRNWSSVPIIIISARTQEHEKVEALDLGADDYITKPFSVRELMARVKANLRKVEDKREEKEEVKKASKIVVGDLELDLEKVEVKIKGQVKSLTPKEFELIKYLAMQPGVPVTREVLLEKVWNYEYYGDIRTVDVTVCRIREKLGDTTKNSKIIINKRGIGYYLASK